MSCLFLPAIFEAVKTNADSERHYVLNVFGFAWCSHYALQVNENGHFRKFW